MGSFVVMCTLHCIQLICDVLWNKILGSVDVNIKMKVSIDYSLYHRYYSGDMLMSDYTVCVESHSYAAVCNTSM